MKKCFVSLFCAILVVFSISFFILTPNRFPLDGQASAGKLPMYVGKYSDGLFQKDFQNWYDRAGPMGLLVRGFNQLKYSILKQGNGDVIVGIDNVLFQKNKIDAFKAGELLTQKYLEKLTDKLLTIQGKLLEQNKAFVLVLTPSKIQFYHQCIPSIYGMDKFDYNNTVYHKLVKLLDQKGIIYVDGIKETIKFKEEHTDIPVYPKTGIHWTTASCINTVNSLLRVLKDKFYFHLRPLNLVGFEKLDYPRYCDDDDIYKLLNLMDLNVLNPKLRIYGGVRDTEYYYPKFTTTTFDNSYQDPKVLIQGGSFGFEITDTLRSQNIITNIDYIFYKEGVRQNINRYTPNNQISIKDFADPVITESIKGADVFMFELNNDFLYDYMSTNGAYLDFLIQYLTNNSIPTIPYYEKLYLDLDTFWDNSPTNNSTFTLYLRDPEIIQKGLELEMYVWIQYLISQHGVNKVNESNISIFCNGVLLKEIPLKSIKSTLKLEFSASEIKQVGNDVLKIQIYSPITYINRQIGIDRDGNQYFGRLNYLGRVR